MAVRFDMSDLIRKRDAINKLMGDKVLAVTQKITLDVGRNLIAASPVDTGEFRGNWDIETPDAPYKPGKVSNATPYGPELANGHSDQAPAGWIPNAINAATRFGGN